MDLEPHTRRWYDARLRFLEAEPGVIHTGLHTVNQHVIVAPMAGVTDLPFRNLCRSFGAELVVAEMVHSDKRLWSTPKSRNRLRFSEEAGVRWLQIAGAVPEMMAEAAVLAEAAGAHMIDINMGCPAKKVCNRAAGSALLRDEALVASILRAVVKAVNIPVTLKIRLGWSPEASNGVDIARIAEAEGISLLTVHGRTRACRFKGPVNYAAIGEINAAVDLPVIANGDIRSAEDALRVAAITGCKQVMVGRAVLGQPWLPARIESAFRGEAWTSPTAAAVRAALFTHVQALHTFYGDYLGLRVARKHVGWFLDHAPASGVRQVFNRLESTQAQLQLLSSVPVESLFCVPSSEASLAA